MAKVLMIQGTMSNAGKSLLTAGLLRIMKQDGYRAAPFKSQNMALNSFITEEGLEMGRAQVVQAEAAGIVPTVHMNPILLKPTTDVGSQVIVHGIHRGNMKAKEYFAYKKQLIPEIMQSFHTLERQYDIIVIEGAGSPAEINLKQDDIVNMGLARLVDAPVLLVGDIDRGGVFAQLYGTVMLLEEEEKQRIKGLIINKFRGDKSILDPGIRMIEDLCQIPVVGVTPYLHVDIEDEDSLGSHLEQTEEHGLVDIAVIRLPRISNFTDFQVLQAMPEVTLRYVKSVKELKHPDLIILPGTKNTMDDLLWMRENGLESAVLKLVSAGVPIFGICGGYQMMGMTLTDSHHTESSSLHSIRGMELIPADTVFETEKTRTQVTGAFGTVTGVLSSLSGQCLTGYEIHMGATSMRESRLPLTYLSNRQTASKAFKSDGVCDGNCYGTYVHGIFDGEGIAASVVRALLKKKGISDISVSSMNYKAYKETQFDLLADGLRNHLQMEQIYQIIGIK